MYRKHQGLTQEQLAEAMGVTVGTISKWENGTFPDIETIVELAEFFLRCLLMYCWDITHKVKVLDSAQNTSVL